MTEVMSELLSDFWDNFQESDPGSCLTKTTPGLFEVKNWVQKRMTPDSIFNGDIVIGVSHLNSEGRGLLGGLS